MTKAIRSPIIPISDRLLIGVPLAVVGGYLDAYTYLFHGGVFANAQTGNLVLLGISISRGEFSLAFSYILPVLAFVSGVLITERMRIRSASLWILRWRHLVLFIEALLLFVIGFLPAAFPDNIVNVTVSFVCAMQVNSFRKLHDRTYATTMCTGNLRSATEALSNSIHEYDSEEFDVFLRYGAILLAFCAGAALGTVMTNLLAGKSAWICSLLLLICILTMKMKESETEQGE